MNKLPYQGLCNLNENSIHYSYCCQSHNSTFSGSCYIHILPSMKLPEHREETKSLLVLSRGLDWIYNRKFFHLTLNKRRSFPFLRCGCAHLCLHTLVNTLLQIKQRVTSCCADSTASVCVQGKTLPLITAESVLPCLAALPTPPSPSQTPPPVVPHSNHNNDDSCFTLVNTPTYPAMYVRELLPHALPS